MTVKLADEVENKAGPQSGYRRVFRKESPWSHVFGAAYESVRTQKALLLGLFALAVFLVFLIGYAIGGGFAGNQANPAASGDLFLTVEQASELRQQATDLQEARSQLSIVEGEAAYLRSQNDALAGDLETIQSSLNAVEVEMSIIVGIYEECMARLYPAECVAAARPRAEAFLAELFSPTP